MDMKIREFKEEDEKQIVDALNTISGIGQDQWKWKFFGNEEIKSKIWVIEDDNHIVGHMALQGVYLNLFDKKVMGFHAVDLFIDEKYRRKGLFVKLGETSLDEAGKEGMAIAYGFPNKEALGGHLKYGWKEIGMVPRAFKPLDIDKYMKRIGKSNPILKLGLRKKSRVKPIPANPYKIKQIETFDDSVDELNQRGLKDFNAVSRSKNYLNWRYCNAPHRQYIKFVAFENEKIVGNIVGYISIGDEKAGYIVDILADPNDSLALRVLINTMEEHLRTLGADAVYTWVPNSDLFRNAFKDSGFIFRKPKQPFIIRFNSEIENKSSIESFDNWFITMGDSDLH